MMRSEQSVRLGKVTGQTISWFNRNPLYSNSHCLYCGNDLRATNAPASNLEHLIAREFVPTGTLDGNQFNFLFRACVACNSRKADLERHVSSISLVNGPGRHEDQLAASAALRKAEGDFHPAEPGIRIRDAGKEFTIRSNFGPAQISFGIVGPPQAHRPFLVELAFCHIQALFTLLTSSDYQSPAGLRLLPQNQCSCYWYYPHGDWGNPQLLAVADRVKDWPCYANVTTARGYFRATIRISEQDEYFWALEWNRYYRVVGAIGADPHRVFEGLPSENWRTVSEGWRQRREVALTDQPDMLFAGTVPTGAVQDEPS